MEGSMDKKNVIKDVALVIARNGFSAEEYFDTREVLRKGGIGVVTVSGEPGQAIAHDERVASVDLTIGEVNPADYAGIFLIGGPGAMEWLNIKTVYEMMRKGAAAGILWGAICISPRILYYAGLLEGRTITGWDGDKLLKKKCPDSNVVGGGVAVDGSLITAEGPSSAKDFGNAILKKLQDKLPA